MPLILAFYLSLAALFLGPGLGLWLAAKWNIARTGLRPACFRAAGLILLVVSSWIAGLQTTSTAVNFLFCLVAFLAYWVLAGAAWTVRPRMIGTVLGVIAYTPVILSILFATVGALALVFILGDHLSPPLEARRLDTSHSCRIMGWGAAFSDGGYTVHLYRSLPWFPLRLEIASVTVNETNPGDGPRTASCDSVAADLGVGRI